jgi:3-oxoacyl-[acyl-carrier-protein] synthase-3
MKTVSVIKGSGAYLPNKIISNNDLPAHLNTNDEWISSRTGIKQRHIADGPTSDLAFNAGKAAILSAGLTIDDIDLIIVATTTPDCSFPATAAIVQHKLGCVKPIPAFDIQAVCAGFIFAMSMADNMIKLGQAQNALVIGADKMSSLVDWNDRGTCVLFGDGAGAVILSAAKSSNQIGILDHALYTDGSLTNILYADGGVSSTRTVGQLKMAGKEVFKHAVEKMSEAVLAILLKNNMHPNNIDLLIPHQANIRILEAIAKRLDLSENKLIATVDQHANTSAASIPLALDYALKHGKISEGDNVVLTAIGGGMSWGTMLIRW